MVQDGQDDVVERAPFLALPPILLILSCPVHPVLIQLPSSINESGQDKQDGAGWTG